MEKVKNLTQFILENFLEKEEIIGLTLVEAEETFTLKIEVKPESIGKVIGKQGKIIKALRHILKIVAFRETDKKFILEVVKD